ncbi:cytochrome ubiquinol oxidase subunit I [Neobacillus sp. MM2021_6]|uniref:cytochrome ubiquinol oxidase subunit I n=1 Tax=Bacillaceae TaxID=186817 RepID=UPI00140E2B53|nr:MULTISPECIES: cytochrome ubiquinol oxidase subunit I [Bacillaceae]MBO0958234.1 cytochrome ubiquinol oxidase subunit I [Neobacillus sp. MM2021_6]NHC17833.1 cytochrome ubiquinol oxidase subunit I [Bacillus sp. MM2020_4]
MDPIMLARIQFAATTIFHFFFVPLSIGLVFMVALMETLYVVKKQELYKKMAKFWGHLFLINFAVGVVTGIIQEFQFGMNWSDYSRFVGDVFGAPLAIEALLAFFMESTFIGLWIFGWERLSKKVHLACIWLVSLGTILSGFWILSANSFMQVPAGFQLNNGRAEMNDFFALITNGQLLVEFPHVMTGAFCTAGFFVAGICAYQLLKKKHIEFYLQSIKIAIIIGLIGSIGAAFSGHTQAQYLVKTQPMKMAAAEGIWNDTADPAPWSFFAWIDTDNRENKFEINVPYAMSFLAYSKFEGSLKGMETLQKEYTGQYDAIVGEGTNYIPPVKTTYWSFRLMIGFGVTMIALSIAGVFLWWKNSLSNSRLFFKLLLPAISFPFLANTFGWVMTEIGRQPWTVFGLMTTGDSISPNVSAGTILFSIIMYMLIFTILAGVMIYLLVLEIKKGPELHEGALLKVSTDPFSKVGA